MLSIIIPARNESDNLKDILDYFTKNLNDIEYEVVLINDFSNDDTFERLKVFSNHINSLEFLIIKKGFGWRYQYRYSKEQWFQNCNYDGWLSDDIKDLIKYNNIMNEKKLMQY